MAVRLSSEQLRNARIVAAIARANGVDPRLAIAMAWQESGLRNSATGDNGSSFGLFQLHIGGMLGSHSQAWARNPRNNAGLALRSLAHTANRGNYGSPGALAAASQRPADPSGYASSVNSLMRAVAPQVLRRIGGGGGRPAAGGDSGAPRPLRPTISGGDPSQYLSMLSSLPRPTVTLPPVAPAHPLQGILSSFAPVPPGAGPGGAAPAFADTASSLSSSVGLTPTGLSLEELTRRLQAQRRRFL